MAGELDESLEGGENALFLGESEEVGDEADDDSVLYHRAPTTTRTSTTVICTAQYSALEPVFGKDFFFFLDCDFHCISMCAQTHGNLS